jgi:hypothetical protein
MLDASARQAISWQELANVLIRGSKLMYSRLNVFLMSEETIHFLVYAPFLDIPIPPAAGI